MTSCFDSDGFTKQTGALLRGLGATELIPEFKSRNLSTNILHKLSVEELITLGLNPKKAEIVHNALNIKRRSGIVVINPEDRIEHFLEIIKHGEQQFSLIQAFVAYCRLRLVKERINMFIDPNKCLSSSEILPISVDATLTEIKEAKKNLSELEELIGGLRRKPKYNILQTCICISSIGLVTFVLFKVCM